MVYEAVGVRQGTVKTPRRWGFQECESSVWKATGHEHNQLEKKMVFGLQPAKPHGRACQARWHSLPGTPVLDTELQHLMFALLSFSLALVLFSVSLFLPYATVSWNYLTYFLNFTNFTAESLP